MGFDTKKFEKAKYQRRTDEIDVITPDIKKEFGEKFTIQNLSGEEIFRVEAAGQKADQKVVHQVLGLLSNGDKEVLDGVKAALKRSDDPPKEYVKAVETIRWGCIDPPMDTDQQIVRLSEIAPYDFRNLALRIQDLSYMGAKLGEPKSSGKKKKSEQPSTSDTPEEK